MFVKYNINICLHRGYRQRNRLEIGGGGTDVERSPGMVEVVSDDSPDCVVKCLEKFNLIDAIK